MTTMIACISPLEFNISETINTINYASRARRIKNAVTKNQSEVGWDDMDYLRNTVLRLRAKITTIENEPRAARRISDAVPESADDDVLQRQVVDLTDKLADLEDEFSHVSLKLHRHLKPTTRSARGLPRLVVHESLKLFLVSPMKLGN